MILKKWLFPASLINVLLLSSCANMPTQNQENLQQGLYDLKGWTGVDIPSYSGNDPNGLRTAPGIDIDGKVGYPLLINALPTGKCINANGQQVPLYRNDSGAFKSQTFPPGIKDGYIFSKDGMQYQISGIPTQRGHWIVTYTAPYIQCGNLPNSVDYHGFTQELRFHITGSGEVVQ